MNDVLKKKRIPRSPVTSRDSSGAGYRNRTDHHIITSEAIGGSRMNTIIRQFETEEYPILRQFLYLAIFVPTGQTPPPEEILDTPELRVYLEGFGTGPADCAVAAQVGDQVVGAAWARIMNDYGHLYYDTPSLAISLLPEYRGMGLGKRLLSRLLEVLDKAGQSRVSLAVQKANRPAMELYQRFGFQIVGENEEEFFMLKNLH